MQSILKFSSCHWWYDIKKVFKNCCTKLLLLQLNILIDDVLPNAIFDRKWKLQWQKSLEIIHAVNYRLMREKRDNFWSLPFHDHFWPFFHQLHLYLSQNWGSDDHLEMPNVSKSLLDQNLPHKLQFVLTTLFFNFWRKKTENLSFKNGHFLTICGHFFLATI